MVNKFFNRGILSKKPVFPGFIVAPTDNGDVHPNDFVFASGPPLRSGQCLPVLNF